MSKFSKDSSAGSSIVPSIDVSRKAGNAWNIPHSTDVHYASTDASLFSSSLPILSHKKLNHIGHSGLSVDDDFPPLSKIRPGAEGKSSVIESNAVGSLLPGNEDELLAGVMDDFDLSDLPTQMEDLEDELFDSGGGMEMDFDFQESLLTGVSSLSMSDGVPNGISNHSLINGGGTVAGEHPYGEHPSRTLFVRNINSNVEDSELKSLFEQYGDIRTLYTACKHRGFVMISYYDIRAARTAMRALQNKPLRRRKLDIHFSIPKDNPSEKDINQGTLVIFNLDASVSNDDLRNIFGAYGEVKEIRETPHKRHHKFIEYYDVRAAEEALKALNRIDIAGKRIKLEPSRPGGARRNLLQQLSQELDQDETWTFRNQVGSPLSSPPGNWTHFGSPVSVQGFNLSPGWEALSPVNSNQVKIHGLASILPARFSNPVKIAPIGKESKEQGRSLQGVAYQHSHSFPEQKLSASPGPVSSFGDSSLNPSGIGTLSGPQFLWGSPTTNSGSSNTSAWPTSSAGLSFTSSGQGKGHLFPNLPSTSIGSHHYHHVGSAPTGIPIERHFSYLPDSPDTSFLSPVAYGGGGVNRNNRSYVTNTVPLAGMGVGIAPLGNMFENVSPSSRMMSIPRNGPIYFGNGPYQGTGLIHDGLAERARARQIEYAGNQLENKKQYQLELDKIMSGEDRRTTLMIKNIPNKYTSKMLLLAIDENHSGTYDFLYLPIDFKNKCNVGYAFINMISPSHIISFYQAFNGKKWEKFNSEKVASLAYARIQGKVALVTHFQNSNLMNEDKRCRPILFQSEGQIFGDKEPFPYNNLNICIRQPDGSYSGDSLESPTSSPEDKNPYLS
ncbi:RNA recognition motif domain [Heracleum sosnowskyi]|uniref:RNA recognition motif domain n=1 Tax=Heracleum sosnowskyi TaxID=360622 RepID=A0AAD8IN74_9APIA|nr:RNA recognition motif domain [Heracleum sosnowskyi]